MAIQVGSVEVDVLPNTQGIYQRLRAGLVPAATRAGEDAGSAAGRSFGPAMQAQVGDIGLRIGEQIGQQIANRITASLRDAIRDGITQGGQTGRPAAARQGQQTGSAFARTLRATLQAAMRDLPEIRLNASSTDAQREIYQIRAQIQGISDARIGIDISSADAVAAIAHIQERLNRLSASDADVQVRVDAAAAATQLAALQAQVNRLDSDDVRINVDATGATAAIFQLGVALGAVAAIPAIPVLAAGIGSIASAAVAAGAGVGALAVAAIPAFLGITKALQAQKAAQDAAATASIKGSQAAGQGAARASQMASAQQALATAHRNAARQISNAQQAVADAGRRAAEANQRAAQQVKQAEQAVAEAVQQAADRQRQAAQQVKDARQGLANAVQQAADRQQAANERVVAAEQSLADAQRTARQAQLDLTQARRDAAIELEDLANRLVNAQLSERDAALSVQEAQQRLNAVRAAGSKASALQQAQAQLAYDQAVQRLKEQQLATKRIAEEKRRADKAGVEGSDRVKGAQDRVAQAQRQVREQTADLAKAQREAARQQQQNALEIAAAQGKVAEAQRNVARVQKDSADAIAAAQDKVAEAQRNARQVQEDGARSVGRAQQSLADAHASAADSIASAQRQISSASQQAAGGMDQAAVAQAKYQAALAKMSPATRATYNALQNLKSAFGDWSASLQPTTMPLFTRALNGMRRALPGLTPFVREAAKAIGELQDRASRGFKSPWWTSFRTDLAGSVRPAIVGLGVSFGNVFKGMAGVIQAFLPHMDSISAKMQSITGRFATWGTSLKGSPEFERFLAYAARTGPVLALTLRDIGLAFLQVGEALSPLSGPLLEVIGALARGLASLANNVPGLIQVMYIAYITSRLVRLGFIAWNVVAGLATAATQLLAVGWTGLNAAMRANIIILVITLLAALVIAVIYAYKRFAWFRAVVQAVWHGIQAVISFVWNSVLKPVFTAIVAGVRLMGRWASWLWRNAIKPAFNGIVLAAKILIAILLVVLFGPLILAFKAAGAIGKWLWKNAIAPAFRGIAAVGKWLYEKVLKPVFNGIAAVARWLYRNVIKPMAEGLAAEFRIVARIGKWLYEKALRPAFRGIGAVAKWLYEKAIRPIFGWIGDRAKWLYEKALRPAFDRVKRAVKLVGAAFGKAKDAVGEAFGKIKKITKDPINFVIKWVYTKGIKAVWDKIAKFVGLPKLPDAPKLLAAGGTVGNGWGPARPMVTNKPTAIVGEGNPRFPEFVIPTDPKYRSRALALHAAAGTKLMDGGGILGGLSGAWDWTKDTVSDVVGKAIDWAKTGADLLVHPSKIWNRLAKPILDKVTKGVGSSPMGKMIAKFPIKMVTGLKNKIVDAVSNMFSSDYAGSGQWGKPINARFGTRFGVRGSMWRSGRHTGLDFPAPVGTTVKAVADGRVTQTARGGPYGNHIMIDHGGGLSSLYAHLSKIRTTVPEALNAGHKIGESGATGNVTGPHLHLEARKNGRAVDPMPYLTGGGGKGFSAAAIGAAQRYAKAMLINYGWARPMFGPLKKLWQGESGWRWNARNPSSGAYGIPQSLPASKMASAGKDWRTNYKTQIRWGLGYIKGRYGSPLAAWNFWNGRSPHWYDQGGWLEPGLNLAYNGTGRPEPVFTTAQANALTRLAGPGAGMGDLSVQVFVGDREITDIARAEVLRSNGELVSTLRAGRR